MSEKDRATVGNGHLPVIRSTKDTKIPTTKVQNEKLSRNGQVSSENRTRRMNAATGRVNQNVRKELNTFWTPFRQIFPCFGRSGNRQGLAYIRDLAPKNDVAEPEITKDPMLIFGFIKFNPKWIIKTTGFGYYCWLTLVTIVVLYNIVGVALRTTFNELNDDNITIYLMAADYTGDAILFLDIFVDLLSEHLGPDLLPVREPRPLLIYWIGKTQGKIDIISILPTDIAFIWTGFMSPYLVIRCNRFLKYYRLNEWLGRTENLVPDPQLFRLASVLFKFFLLIHLNACAYYFISDQVGLNSDGWVYPAETAWRKEEEGQTNADDSLYKKYIWSFYWSFHALTMIGITKQPETPWQFLFLTVEFVAGVMLYSQILANTIQTVLKATAHARKFRTKVDLVMQYLDLRGVSGELRQRVMDYFEYQWIQKRLIDDRDALRSLPEQLEADLAIKVHLATLKHVRIFQGVEPGLLVDLVLKLQLQVYAPGEYVCRKGDIGRELYIIKTGNLDVVSDDGSFVFARLGAGSVFGEISILNIKGIKSGNRRTANVRSIGYADLFRLSKDDLWQALTEYPEGKNKILELGRQILVKDNLINLEDEQQNDATEKKFYEKFIKVEDGVDDIQLKFARLVAERAAAVHKMQHRINRLEILIERENQRENDIKKENLTLPTVRYGVRETAEKS